MMPQRGAEGSVPPILRGPEDGQVDGHRATCGRTSWGHSRSMGPRVRGCLQTAEKV